MSANGKVRLKNQKTIFYVLVNMLHNVARKMFSYVASYIAIHCYNFRGVTYSPFALIAEKSTKSANRHCRQPLIMAYSQLNIRDHSNITHGDQNMLHLATLLWNYFRLEAVPCQGPAATPHTCPHNHTLHPPQRSCYQSRGLP